MGINKHRRKRASPLGEEGLKDGFNVIVVIV